MMKVSEIPVSYHTGVADISIPIHTVSDGALSVPITLTYHSSGTKVEEIASWTGLGWSLSAGGAITRTVIGGLDEGANLSYGNSALTGSGFYKDYGIPDPIILCSDIPSCEGSGPVATYHVVPDDNTIDGNDDGTDDDENDLDDEWEIAHSSPDYCNCKDFSTDAADGFIDTEPDLFFFNFNGISGKFFFDENRKVHCIPEQDLKIEPEFTMTNVGEYTQLGFESWKVTTPDGTKYFFGETFVEYGYTDAIGAGGTAIHNISSTTWYLYAIESVNQENRISISYEPDNFGYRNRTSHTVSVGEWTAPTGSVTIAPTTLMTTTATGWRVSKIQTKHDFEEVDFLTTSTPRQDLIGNPINEACTSKPLGEIKITHNDDGTCQRFVFDYGYFTSPNTNSNYDNLDVTDKKRLRLNSLQEFNCDGESIPAYLFYYNETPIGRRFSLGRDAWGYYNGADQNTGLLPDDINLNPYFSANPHAPLMGGADRAPHGDYMKACMLDSLRYPTGGVISFEYEPHFLDGQTIGGLRIKKIKYDDKLSGHPFVREYEYISGYLYTTSPITIYDPAPDVYSYDGYDGDFGIHIYSTPSTPLYSSQGYHIGYSQVSVHYGDGSKSKYYYSAYSSGSGYGYPVPPQQYQIGGGELLKEEHYNAANTMVSSKVYTYTNTVGNVNIAARKVATLTKMAGSDINCNTCGYGDTYVFFKDYSIYTARHLLTKITEMLDGVTKETNFEYDSQNRHGNPVATYFENSDQKVHRSETKYAYEANPAIHTERQAMLDNYMIGIPLEQVAYVDGNLVGGGRLKYGDFNGLLAPEYFYKIEDNDGVLQANDFVLKGTVTEYYTTFFDKNYGLPKKFQKENFPFEDIFTFSETGLLTQKNYGARNWYYTYYSGSDLLKSITDYNNQRNDYEYDGFRRLKKVKSRPNNTTSPTSWNIVTQYSYQYTGILNAITTSTTFSDAPAMATKQWLDGLGRPVSSHNVNHTPDGKDLITAVAYDANGREVKQYLPREGNLNGSFVTPSGTYTETEYELSPLNRPIEQTMPSFGAVTYGYGTNGSDVKNHDTGGFYAAGSLYKKVTTDENGNPTETYTDKAGRQILIRKYVSSSDNNSKVDTYYVYEDDGDLKSVVPPLASDPDDDLYAYFYTYDARHRLLTKRIPGAGTTSLSYNNRDLLVGSIDANSNELAFDYDDYNRKTKTYLGGSLIAETFYQGVKDWADYSNTKVMDDSNPNWWLMTDFTTDDFGRVTHTYAQNHLGANKADQTTIVYNDKDQILSSTRRHDGYDAVGIEINQSNAYDNGGRLSDISHSVAGGGIINPIIGAVNLARYNYTFRDEMQRKYLQATAPGAPFNYLQKVDYEYNLRGFLTKINQFDLAFKTYQEIPLCPEPPPINEEASCSPVIVHKINIELEYNNAEMSAGTAQTFSYRFEGDKYPCKEKGLHKGIVNMPNNTVTEPVENDSLGYDNMVVVALETIVRDSSSKRKALKEAAEKLSEALDLKSLPLSGSFDPDALSIAVQDSTFNANGGGNAAENMVNHTLSLLFSDIGGAPNVIAPNEIGAQLDDHDLFALELYYASENPTAGAEGQLNGNIAQMVWQTAGRNKRSYGFHYDGLNRYTAAKYTELLCAQHDQPCQYITNDLYSENSIQYDKHGNITHIQRSGPHKTEQPRGYCYTQRYIDNLTYTYTGNQVRSINDLENDLAGFTDGAEEEQEYEYDPNGNLTSDMNKSIFKIEYNFLNLPVQIFFNNGAKIKILYDAAGTKLRKTYTDQHNNVTTQDYDGGIEYYDQVLSLIPHPEGRVAVIKKDDRLTYRYEYVITDHLGNARVTFADVNEDQVIGIEDIIQENHYYPFGLDMQGAWTPPTGEWNRHKYNGKDWNKEEALNWYDYGARWYDPAVGRWWSVDPLAEVSRRWSPYAYCYDNPMRFVDPDGMLIGDFLDQKGNKIGTDGNPDHNNYVVTDANEIAKIKRNDKKGGTTSLDQVKSAIKLPSYEVRSAMGEAADKSNQPTEDDLHGGFHEESLAWGKDSDLNEMILNAPPGEYYDPSEGSMIPTDFPNLEAFEQLEGTAHVHPGGVNKNGDTWDSPHSGEDQLIQLALERGEGADLGYNIKKPITGHSYVIRPKINQVDIYNGNGTIATFPLDKLRSIKN